MIAQLQGHDVGATSRALPARKTEALGTNIAAQAMINSKYRGAQGLDPEFIAELEAQFGFDKPAPERFWKMVKKIMRVLISAKVIIAMSLSSTGAGKTAGFDLARAVVDAAYLFDFHSIGHCQSGA